MPQKQGIIVPAVITLLVYTLLNKLFPEKDLRNGDLEKTKVFQKIIKKILNRRNLKIALLTGFVASGVQYFNHEVEELLLDNVINEICIEKVEGKLKIVCDIVKEHDLNLHPKAVRELIIAGNLSKAEKVKLLKIKLDFMINGQVGGKKRFLLLSVLAVILTCTLSGVAGLAVFLEALYQLFQEGKISRALLNQVLLIVSKKYFYNKTVEYLD